MPNAADHDYPAEEAINTWVSTKDTPPRNPPYSANGAHPASDKEATLDTSIGIGELVRQTLAALAKRHDPTRRAPELFQREGALVRIHYDEHDRPIVKLVDEHGLDTDIADAVQFTRTKVDKNGDETHLSIAPPGAYRQGRARGDTLPSASACRYHRSARVTR